MFEHKIYIIAYDMTPVSVLTEVGYSQYPTPLCGIGIQEHSEAYEACHCFMV